MIEIQNKVIKKQPNFWNNCLFHPTDAIEDSWGKRILDRMAEDKSIYTIRLYTMMEDIVYKDMNGNLQYDFRVNDLRLDYLIEKGYDVLLAFAAMPDCIARNTNGKTANSFSGTRYKGKMFNTSPPKDYALWEEVCYQYTKHIVERYGVERVQSWHLQCFNEPDIPSFFMAKVPMANTQERVKEYCKLYEAFEHGIRRVSDKLKIGGAATATSEYAVEFTGLWLQYVKEKNLKLDFISYHSYGVWVNEVQAGTGHISVDNHIKMHEKYMNIIKDCGFADLPIVIDEWGMMPAGFHNKTNNPIFEHRETELFSAYFAKLIHGFIRAGYNIEKLIICLSGQHEMDEDFTGFRNFFSLNYIAKPIYNCYVLASKLGENLLEYRVANENISVIPTKDENGNYSILLSYASEIFKEDIPNLEDIVCFEEDITGRKVSVWCIDKNTTNPYRFCQRAGKEGPETEEEIKLLREEGSLKPIQEIVYSEKEDIKLKLTPNSTFLITVEYEN